MSHQNSWLDWTGQTKFPDLRVCLFHLSAHLSAFWSWCYSWSLRCHSCPWTRPPPVVSSSAWPPRPWRRRRRRRRLLPLRLNSCSWRCQSRDPFDPADRTDDRMKARKALLLTRATTPTSSKNFPVARTSRGNRKMKRPSGLFNWRWRRTRKSSHSPNPTVLDNCVEGRKKGLFLFVWSVPVSVLILEVPTNAARLSNRKETEATSKRNQYWIHLVQTKAKSVFISYLFWEKKRFLFSRLKINQCGFFYHLAAPMPTAAAMQLALQYSLHRVLGHGYGQTSLWAKPTVHLASLRGGGRRKKEKKKPS